MVNNLRYYMRNRYNRNFSQKKKIPPEKDQKFRFEDDGKSKKIFSFIPTKIF